MSNYGKYARNIAKGKLPYENWNQFYTNYQKSVSVLSDVQFALNFVSLLYTEEIWQEEGLAALGNEFLTILWDTVDGGFAPEQSAEEICAYRAKLKNHMDCLVTYTDRYMVYQYVMNCMRYRFEDYEYEDYDDEEFTKELMNYICADQDQANVRYKTMEVLKALPIRMTRTRFFEQVKDGYSVYNGSDLDTLESFDYMVRGAAMLYMPENMEKNFPDLAEYDAHFSGLDFESLDQEAFYKENIALQECIEFLNNQITACQAFSEAVNQLYAFVLSHEYADSSSNVYQTCRNIANYVRNHVVPGEAMDLDDQLVAYLETLEGTQEEELEKLEDADGHYQDICQTQFAATAPEQICEELNLVDCLSQLISTSYFMDLDEEKEVQTATEDTISAYFGAFRTALEPKLKEMPKLMSRGVMAAVIGYLPMNFETSEELRQHIYNSLSACTNLPEKMALVERLEELMDEDDWE
jgi:hypothetical protein